VKSVSLLCCGLEDPEFDSRLVLLFETSTTDPDSASTRILSPTVKRTGSEFEPSSLSSDEVIKGSGSNSCTWPLCLHGLDRDNPTFTIYILAYTRFFSVLGYSGNIQWEYIRYWFREQYCASAKNRAIICRSSSPYLFCIVTSDYLN
jgi:hypothetical protein